MPPTATSGRLRVLVALVLSALLLGGSPAVGARDRSDPASQKRALVSHRHKVDFHAHPHAHHRAHHGGRPNARHRALHRARPLAHHRAHHRAERRRRENPPVPPATTPTPAAPPPATPARSLPAGWITTPDGSRRVDALSATELQPSTLRSAVHVPVDAGTRFQEMDGFGAALTESSAHLLMRLPPEARTAALRSLFDPVAGAGLDLVRLPLGASDFSLTHHTYADAPAGATDPTLSAFSLDRDEAEILPVLREAVRINPRLRVMGTAWSAPAWMKTSRSLIGGSLAADRTDVYADYLARTVHGLRQRGVPLTFLTLGNEPKHSPHDYPGMLMSPRQQADLATALSARLAERGLHDVRLIGYDHNWDDTAYPTTLLADPAARGAVAGTAFHCYAGTPDAQSVVHAAAPDKGIWFTECSGGAWSPGFAGNLGWNARNLLVGATRNWARSVLLWNLALDPAGGPHKGGCGNCRGVLTVDPATGTVERNVEYDVLALAGKAVRPGAVRIATPASVYGVQTVAYLNPDGSRVLTAYNSWQTDQRLVVDAGATSLGAPLPAGSVVTLTW